MEPPQAANHKQMINLTSKMEICTQKISPKEHQMDSKNQIATTKTKSKIRTKNHRVTEKDESVKIEKNKDYRKQ